VSQDYSRVARPEQDTKGVRPTNTPFEDSAHATHPQDSGRATHPENETGRKLPRRLPSFEIRQTPYPSDSVQLNEPPPVPYVPSKQQLENMNLP
jgi:hypothetical protein